MNKIQHKSDGTFIILFKGLPFHVTPDYPTAELYGEDVTFEAISAYANSHPDEITEYVESESLQQTSEELERMRLLFLESEAQKLLPAIQAGIDVEYNQQRLIDVMLEIEELKGNL